MNQMHQMLIFTIGIVENMYHCQFVYLKLHQMASPSAATNIKANSFMEKVKLKCRLPSKMKSSGFQMHHNPVNLMHWTLQ